MKKLYLRKYNKKWVFVFFHFLFVFLGFAYFCLVLGFYTFCLLLGVCLLKFICVMFIVYLQNIQAIQIFYLVLGFLEAYPKGEAR